MPYHILNGDALKDLFPKQLVGEQIVARECLVDGNVQGETLEEFYANRANFISTYFQDSADGEYYERSVPEFEKILSIPEGSEINLWFEDDLFCQVNLWFVLHLLFHSNNEKSLYLIRPTASLQLGFGGMDQEELIRAFGARIEIPNTDLKTLNTLWRNYQKGDTLQLLKIAEGLNQTYPFLVPAVRAHIDSVSDEGNLGKPGSVIKKIIEELKTTDFGIVFGEFCKREPIYGFGDLQVKRIWQKVINSL